MTRPSTPRADAVRRLITADAALGPVVRNTVQGINKRLYPYLTRRVDDNVFFLNWGYEEDPAMAIPLEASDEPHRYPIQLYHSTATQAGGLAGKQVLEVGCGHGGGASYLARALGPASYVGLDLNPKGIEFCRRNHQVPGLEFVQGNAESLPFPAESFDAVINVESSHCYPHFDRFLGEVERVLRRGGAFLYTDVRQRYECPRWEEGLASATGLQLVSWREINTEVLRGLDLNPTPWGGQVMDSLVPKFMRRVARQGAPVRESWIYRNLENGRMSYRMYYFVKG
ncbi:class I SAM-dependent methyltransferase [Mycolicibacterium pulveris]|nr:class I SAM-dependent methyltransferase [Mycolicibacterium pulveris]